MHYLVPTGSAHEQIEQPDWENCNYLESPGTDQAGILTSHSWITEAQNHLQPVTSCCLGWMGTKGWKTGTHRWKSALQKVSAF